MAGGTPLRVLLVDDHELVRVGLRTLLESSGQFQVIADVGSAAEAAAVTRTQDPEVIVLDVRLPDGNGVDVCRALRTVAPASRILMLSAFDDEVVPALLAGASGFVLKSINVTELLDAIRVVGHGGSYLGSDVTRRVVDRLRTNQDAPGDEDRLSQLSDQERRILPLIAEGKTNREIAQFLSLSEHTVKIYVSDLLSKLRVKRRSQAAAFIARRQVPTSSPNEVGLARLSAGSS
jgi:two-component system response regulator DevR